MSTTVEAVIDKDGVVRLLEHVPLTGSRRALVIILDEEPAGLPNETALLSEAAASRFVQERLCHLNRVPQGRS